MQTTFGSVLTNLEQLVIKNLHQAIRNSIPAAEMPLTASGDQGESVQANEQLMKVLSNLTGQNYATLLSGSNGRVTDLDCFKSSILEESQHSQQPCSPVPVLPDAKLLIENLGINILELGELPDTPFFNDSTRVAIRELPVPFPQIDDSARHDKAESKPSHPWSQTVNIPATTLPTLDSSRHIEIQPAIYNPNLLSSSQPVPP